VDCFHGSSGLPVVRVVRNNLICIGSILVQRAGYEVVRRRFIRDEYDRACYDGAVVNLDRVPEETGYLGRSVSWMPPPGNPPAAGCNRW